MLKAKVLDSATGSLECPAKLERGARRPRIGVEAMMDAEQDPHAEGPLTLLLSRRQQDPRAVHLVADRDLDQVA